MGKIRIGKSHGGLRDIERSNIVGFVNNAITSYLTGVITKKELGQIIGITFASGEFSDVMWGKENYGYYDDMNLINVFLQLHHNQLITEDVLRKQVFGLEPKKAVTPEEDK